MRANKIVKSLVLATAALLTLPLANAQQSESHMGKLTGHADAG